MKIADPCELEFMMFRNTAPARDQIMKCAVADKTSICKLPLGVATMDFLSGRIVSQKNQLGTQLTYGPTKGSGGVHSSLPTCSSRTSEACKPIFAGNERISIYAFSQISRGAVMASGVVQSRSHARQRPE
jgi:hypothetical protein